MLCRNQQVVQIYIYNDLLKNMLQRCYDIHIKCKHLTERINISEQNCSLKVYMNLTIFEFVELIIDCRRERLNP